MEQECTNAEEQSKAITPYIFDGNHYCTPCIFHGNHYYLRKSPKKHTREQSMGESMAAITEKQWILILRYIVKRVIRNCFGCKSFHTTPFTSQQQSILPSKQLQKQDLFK